VRGEPDPFALHAATLHQLQQREVTSGASTSMSTRPSSVRSETYAQPAPADATSMARPTAPRGVALGPLIGAVWFVIVWTLILGGKLFAAMFKAAVWGFSEIGGHERYDWRGRRVE